MLDAEDEYLAMSGRSEHKGLPLRRAASAALRAAAVLLSRPDPVKPAEPMWDEAAADGNWVPAVPHVPDRIEPAALLALRERAARLDGGDLSGTETR